MLRQHLACTIMANHGAIKLFRNGVEVTISLHRLPVLPLLHLAV
jgi:hypothetical protein